MIDPFTAWMRIVSAQHAMQSTWLRGLDTLQAANTVIGARADKMGAAAATPFAADYTELSLMVPEKIDAFTKSAQIVGRDVLIMHAAWAKQMRIIGVMMMSGRVPTLSELMTIATQSVDYTFGAMTAGANMSADALAPIHRTATRNARRLKRTGAR